MSATPDLALAEKIAKSHGMRITQKAGVFNVWRNTYPRLTFIGQKVNAAGVLDLVKKAARVE